MNLLFNELLNRVKEEQNKCCIVADEQLFTYGEFLQDIEVISEKIKSTTQERCIIYMERCYEMFITMWAIMKVGGVYIPIDINYTEKHFFQVLENSKGTKILVDEANYIKIKKMVFDYDLEIIIVSSDQLICERKRLSYEECSEDVKQFSYILYTSGTTGKPKGTQISYKALEAFIYGFHEILLPYDFTTILAHTSNSFDISIVEMIYPMIYGKTVVLCRNSQNVKMIQNLIATYEIDCLQITPTLLNLVLCGKKSRDKLTSIRTLIIGGEAVPKGLIETVRKDMNCTIINAYGPTESTVWCSACVIEDKENISIGNGFGINKLFLLDSDNHVIQEQNVTGELCIAGEQLAVGYVGRKDLTVQVFVDESSIYPERFYRTGDLAFIDENRNFVIKGRIDRQVKLNGKRLELEEIEEAVRKLEMVQDAVVVVKDSNVGKKIWCYYVADEELSSAKLTDELKKYLEQWKIPKIFKKIEKIPLTISGKICRNNL